MAKLQGLLFGLATLVLVVVATVLFTKDWLPPLNSDRPRGKPARPDSNSLSPIVYRWDLTMPRRRTTVPYSHRLSTGVLVGPLDTR